MKSYLAHVEYKEPKRIEHFFKYSLILTEHPHKDLSPVWGAFNTLDKQAWNFNAY